MKLLKKSRLKDLLKKGDKNLYKRLESIWSVASDNYLKFINVENFTDHGENHVLNIENNIYKLLILNGKTIEKLSSFDLFCLLSACCLHDIGMIAKKNSGENTLSIRSDHHQRVKSLLEEKYLEFQLNEQEARIIGIICYGHGITNLDELEVFDNWSIAPYGKVKTLLLTALLRVGDLLDLTFLRAPKIVSDIKKIKGDSLRHWKLHNKISDVQIENKGITIYASLNNEYELIELYKLKNWLREEIDIVKGILRENDIFIDSIFLKTNLDKRKVLSEENPFLRLDSFDWKKHIAFFGRDKEIMDVLKKTINNKLTILVGESGVGKTSLLNAGLKQRLIEKGYYVFNVRASQDFQDDLFRNIKRQFCEFSSKDFFRFLKRLSKEGFTIVILFDQFEEIFTFKNVNLKSTILSFFEEILTNDEISLKIVLCLREEFLAYLWELSESMPELYDRNNTYRLKKLAREEAKQSIINTIKHIKYQINDNLVEQLLDDFTQQEESIYPPYIQIVCHRVFSNHKTIYKEISKKTPINLPDYKKLGKSQKIITEYFEEILDGFSFEEREVINEILAHMITYFHTKQRITQEKIEEINKNRIDIDKTLNRLINHRIIKKIETEKNEYELIHDFLAKEIMESKTSGIMSSKIKKAIEYIDENFNKPIKLKDITRKVGISKEHFCRIFKVETKKTFVEYVNKKRIDESKKILRNPKIKINEIYLKIGFTNQQHFTKVFKTITGHSPTIYRKYV